MVYFAPKSKLGKISLILIIAFIAGFIIMQILIALGMRGGETFFSNIPLALTGITTALLGIGSFVTGLISIITKKERSILTFVSTLIGFLVLFFVAGEFISPH